ncbi:MAG: efflux RND transporter permease subunit, partial [Planctomycetales bacterium]
VYVLCISTGVHVANYYRDAICEHGLEGAAIRAIRYAWTPCWLSAITTSVGMLSLVVSMIVPIRQFGGYASAAVLAGTGIVVLLLPCLLAEFPLRKWAEKVQEKAKRQSRFRWEWLLAGVSRFHGIIVIAAIVGVIGVGWGVAHLKATARLHNLFHSDSKILADYDWLEQNVGPLVPVEVVLQIPHHVQKTALERMQFVENVRQEIDQVAGVDRTISAATFGPTLPDQDASGWRQTARRAVFARKLENSLEKFSETGYIKQDTNHELWRISARVRATSDVEYSELLHDLETRIDTMVSKASVKDLPGVTAMYCGAVPLVHKAQDQLMDDLINSFLIAFAIIAVIMMLLLRSWRAGLVSMIPNALPALGVFGIMGWMGVEIEVGSILTATAALGIAVDDTLHFIAAFRHGLEGGCSRRKAVLHAYHKCGAAMIQTSLICGLGLMVFAMSPFAPIARFGWLMGAMLGTALIGDLIVLPAVLIGYLGRAFVPKTVATLEGPQLRQKAA